MKTYIWNTEYDVAVAQSENVEKARKILHSKFVKQSINFLIDEKDKESLKEKIPLYVLPRAEGILTGKLNLILDVFSRPPDIIIEEEDGLIYFHANE